MTAKGTLGRLRLRLALSLGATLPFVLFLLLAPAPAPAESNDYLPSARARTVAAYLVKSLKSLPSEKAGFAGADLAAESCLQQRINLVISLGVESPVQLRPFERLTRQPARSPPNLFFSVV